MTFQFHFQLQLFCDSKPLYISLHWGVIWWPKSAAQMWMCLRIFHKITEGMNIDDASLIQRELQRKMVTDFLTQPDAKGQRVTVWHKKKMKKSYMEEIVYHEVFTAFFFLCHAVGKHTNVNFLKNFLTLVRFVCLCPGGREFKFLFRALFHLVRPDELNISTDWQQHRRYTKGNNKGHQWPWMNHELQTSSLAWLETPALGKER